jgi:hypothetical protein
VWVAATLVQRTFRHHPDRLARGKDKSFTPQVEVTFCGGYVSKVLMLPVPRSVADHSLIQ